MTALAWILVVAGVATLSLDVYAIRKVCASSFYDPGQRRAQAALILFFPVGGACLALYLCRDDIPCFQPTSVDHAVDAVSSNIDIDYRD
jgi:hypothetical protein